mgnify:CR=1 FL=1
MEWTIRPALQAFPVSIIFITYMIITAYSVKNGNAQVHIIMYAISPALMLLFIAIRGRTYTLKNNVLTVMHFKRPIQSMGTLNIVDMTIRPVGIRSGHVIFTNAYGARLTLKNIALSRNRMAQLERL